MWYYNECEGKIILANFLRAFQISGNISIALIILYPKKALRKNDEILQKFKTSRQS